MYSITEAGHVKNALNFARFINIIMSCRDKYKPSLPAHKIEVLIHQTDDIWDVMDQFSVAEKVFNKVFDQREVLFDSVAVVAARVVQAMKSAGVSPLTLAEAYSDLDRLRSGKYRFKREAMASQGNNPVGISDAQEADLVQLCFDNKICCFENLLRLAEAEPLYATDEPDLKLSALQSLLTQLKARNEATRNAQANLDTLRKACHQALYTAQTGLFDTARTIKNDLRNSAIQFLPEYQQLQRITFTRMSTGN